MVRTGSEELNHPELMRNYPMNLAPSGAQWFEEFGVVQLLRTYSNHSYNTGNQALAVSHVPCTLSCLIQVTHESAL